jgi:hypothetical protein
MSTKDKFPWKINGPWWLIYHQDQSGQYWRVDTPLFDDVLAAAEWARNACPDRGFRAVVGVIDHAWMPRCVHCGTEAFFGYPSMTFDLDEARELAEDSTELRVVGPDRAYCTNCDNQKGSTK